MILQYYQPSFPATLLPGRQLQAATRPPTFVFFVNDAKLFNEDYRLYMVRSLRESIGLAGTPLRLFFRSRRPGLTNGERPKGEAIVAGRRPSRAPHAG